MSAEDSVEFLRRAAMFCEDQADDMRDSVGRLLNAEGPGAVESKDYSRILTSVRSGDRQRLWQMVRVNCLHLLVNVADHLRAIKLLLSQPQVGVPIYAHATAARVAVESGAMLMYLLDDEQSSDVRFSRSVAHLIADANAASRAAALVPANALMASPADAFAKEQDRLLELVKQARIEVVMGKRDVKGIRVVPGGPEAPVGVKSADLVQARFADMPAVYNMLSGVTHGMPWRLADSTRIEGRSALWAPDPIDVGGSVLAAVAAAERTTALYAWYRGFPEDQVVTRMRGRVAAVDDTLRAFAQKRMRRTE
jgi:hypothetical protein